MIPLKYSLRSLAVRKTTSGVSALGIGLVVFVLASSLMLAEGVKKTLGRSGKDDVAVVMRKGADNELSSSIEDATVSLIKAQPGIAQQNGLPQATGEAVVVVAMDKVGAHGVSNVAVRGVPDNGMAFRPNLKVVAGRAPRPGSDEARVGTRIRGRFVGLDLESSFELKKNRPVKVVGVFEDDGSSFESEVWADLETVRSSFGRQGIVSAVRVRLESPSKFDTFQAAVGSDKRLGLQAVSEPKYYEKLSEGTSIFITALGSLVSFFFSVGAMIGAMITMYAAVSSRQREIGTLRALGFSRTSILTSFVIESVTLALAGGALGVLAAFALGNVKISMMNFASFSEVVFAFDPTPNVLVTAFVFAGVMGLFGGLLPAVRAARVSPVTAMRGG
jgi:putative ABC transport system permease protein